MGVILTSLTGCINLDNLRRSFTSWRDTFVFGCIRQGIGSTVRAGAISCCKLSLCASIDTWVYWDFSDTCQALTIALKYLCWRFTLVLHTGISCFVSIELVLASNTGGSNFVPISLYTSGCITVELSILIITTASSSKLFILEKSLWGRLVHQTAHLAFQIVIATKRNEVVDWYSFTGKLYLFFYLEFLNLR